MARHSEWGDRRRPDDQSRVGTAHKHTHTPNRNQTDSDLATAAQHGDTRALDILLSRHADRIYAICRRVLSHQEDARDASQEAMIAVAKGLKNFDGRSQFTTWLYRVATNAALDEARRRNRRPIPVDKMLEQAAPGSLDTAVTDRIVIDAAMLQVAPEFRAAVTLRDLHMLDYAEIASVLGIPAGTVRSRIARGRAALAAILAEDSGNQSPPHEHQSS